MMLSKPELERAKEIHLQLHENLAEGDKIRLRYSVNKVPGIANAKIVSVRPLHAWVELTTPLHSSEAKELLPKGKKLLIPTPKNKCKHWSQFKRIEPWQGKTILRKGGNLPKGVSDGKGNVTHDGLDGGNAVGYSHEEGGIPAVNVDTGQRLELEGNEGVLCKKVMTDKEEVTLSGTPREIATQMQVKHGCNPMDTTPGSTAEKGGGTDEGFDEIKEPDTLEETTGKETSCQKCSKPTSQPIIAPVEQFMKNGGVTSAPPKKKEEKPVEVSGGFAIFYKNKILLTHPTNGSWYGTYSIPKGQIEKGENSYDAALRETWEEIAIAIQGTPKLKNTMQSVEYKRPSGKVYKRLDYFTLHINKLSDIGIVAEKIPKHDLQLEEVDWAGFVDTKEAKKRITKAQLPIIEAAEQEKSENGYEWIEIERSDIIAGDYIRAVSSNGKDTTEGTVKNLNVLKNAIPLKESKVELPWHKETDYYKRYTHQAIKKNGIATTKKKLLNFSDILEKSHSK